MTSRHRVLLAGDASARPAGLERALTRAGFLLIEVPPVDGDLEPDAILVTLAGWSEREMRAAVAAGRPDSPPVVVVVAAANPDVPASALTLGAADALAAPVHLPELCARLQARIRDRQRPRGAPEEAAVRRALDGLVGEGRLTLRPDEVVLALVRRLARALDLAACSFVAVGPGANETHVVAEVGPGPAVVDGECRLNLTDSPAIAEVIRSRGAATLPGGGGTAIPAIADGRLLGVLLIQRRELHTGLSPAQLHFAESLAEAAARALEVSSESSGTGAPPTLRPSAPPADQLLDHRLQEEFERARRYSLSFSLVLLDVGARGAEGGEKGLSAAAERLRQGLRLPDFLSRYGGAELAIILPETGVDGARRSVVRLREQLARRTPDSMEDLSFSAGIVTYPHPAVTQADDMFALVEAALARGKAQVAERVGIAD